MQTSLQSNCDPESSENIGKRATATPEESSGTMKGLIVNADDWGRNAETTDRILDCFHCGALSSTSGMVFMEDSERAAEIALENGLDVGLHLNFTTHFSSPAVPQKLLQAQLRLTRFLRSSRLAQVFFHPGLTGTFRDVVDAQIDEHRRLYGRAPKRIDGHHHMHLCANVLFGGLLPAGTIVRRSFSFDPGEKSGLNRMYRRCLDRMIERDHPVAQYFFSIEPIDKMDRLRRIVNLAKTSLVELETHPASSKEFLFLIGGEFFRRLDSVKISPHYEV
jgi:predicted glycoside hydrolase/deacetylase ChbG (UPF0249 family)